jgi:hypothetical protein
LGECAYAPQPRIAIQIIERLAAASRLPSREATQLCRRKSGKFISLCTGRGKTEKERNLFLSKIGSWAVAPPLQAASSSSKENATEKKGVYSINEARRTE